MYIYVALDNNANFKESTKQMLPQQFLKMDEIDFYIN